MDKHEIGDKILVEITSITNYGLFIKFEKYSGLIHISEIKNEYIHDINEIYEVGEKVNCIILEIDEVKKHLKLSIKELNYKNKKNKNRLVEKGTGFNLLEENLEKWIKTKKSEYEKKINKF